MIKSRRTPSYGINIGSIYDRNLNQYTWPSAILEYYQETTDSGNHPGWQMQSDGGGYFSHQLTEYRSHPSRGLRVSATAGGSNPFISYTGVMTCSPPTSSLPTGDGTPWGAIAYDAMKPTKFDYSLFNMVYELKDMPRMINDLKGYFFFEAFKRPGGVWREGSKRFLSHQFGWLPFVNDVMTLIEKQQKIQQRIEWLIRNQGKWVPRKVELVSTETKTVGDWVSDYGCLNPILTNTHYITVPSYRDTRIVKDKVWASAQFKYFLPSVPPGVQLNDVVKRQLQGFHSPRPHELYNAIPWTWLISWCFDIAKVLANCDPGVADRVGARRFYIMRTQETIVTRQAQAIMRGYGGAPNVPVVSTAWRRDLNQTRVKGSPFYPGNPNDLSDMQLAILGALGLSRF